MMRRGLATAGVALLVFAATACGMVAPARATRELTLGFSADYHLAQGTTSTRAPWIARAVSVGADVVRVNVNWSQVAPRRRPKGFDPSAPGSRGYRWSNTDAVVRQLASHGLHVLITVWDAPAWAQGAHKPGAERQGTWRPNAADLGEFAKALALRYDGQFPDPSQPGAFLPRVDRWQAWNEPNLDYYLSPNGSAPATAGRRSRRVSTGSC